MKNIVYTLPEGKDIHGAVNAVIDFLKNKEKMETQKLGTEDGTMIIQARVHNGKIKQWVGLDKAITVKLVPLGRDAISMEVGEGEWLKKSMAMGVGTFVFAWPLAVTAVVGMTKQARLPGKIAQAVKDYLDYTGHSAAMICGGILA